MSVKAPRMLARLAVVLLGAALALLVLWNVVAPRHASSRPEPGFILVFGALLAACQLVHFTGWALATRLSELAVGRGRVAQPAPLAALQILPMVVAVRCGLASVIPSPGEQVWGAVFEVTDEDLKLMDLFEEDAPANAFRQVQVTVVTEAGEKVLVTTYAATPIGKFKPKAHYLDWIMKGLKHWKLPNDCIEQWQAYGPK